MSSLRQMRWTLRSLRRRPLLTAVVLLTLTLGIGANVAIFSLVHSVLLTSLAYPDADELVTLWQDETRRDGPEQEWTSWDNFADWRAQGTSFEEMAAVGGWRPTLTGDGEAEMLSGAVASHTLLEVLELPPQLGRDLTAEDDLAGSEGVVLLGHELWQRRFGGDRDVVGRTLRLSGNSYEVVGVLPPGFEMPIIGAADVLAPLRIDPSNSCGRGCITLRVVARLGDGITVERAGEQMATVASRLEQEHPGANKGVQIRLIPLHDLVVGSVRAPLLVLLGAVGLVLLICCGNVANLLLARAQERRGELALRSALGAGRAHLVWQTLSESLALSLLGGALGTGAAALAVRQLGVRLAGELPRIEAARVDATVLAFALGLSLAAGLIFGIAPALRTSRSQLQSSMQQALGARSTGRLRSGLVVAEVALALVLLLAAGVLVRSFLALTRVDLGVDTERVLMTRVNLSPAEYPEAEQRVAFAAQARERLAALPGVTSVSHTMSPPLAGFDGDSNFVIEGAVQDPEAQPPVAWVRSVDADFFRHLGIELTRGRAFDARDGQDALDVAILNEAAVQRYFDGESPIGRRIHFGGDPPRWRQIVGTVADTRHFGLTAPARPAAYFPFDQSPVGTLFFLLRSSGDPYQLTAPVRAAIAELDPNLAISQVQTLDELVTRATSSERLLAGLIGTFSVLALVLAALGLYGVMSYTVAQRRRELGIRMAIGADRRDLIGRVLAQGMALVGIGTALGLVAALLAGRVLRSVLYAVEPHDPATYLSVPLVLAAVAAVAILIPARRAVTSDLPEVLRSE
ncbi:MAG: ABC transporter permease [Acidobacteria bacterium]|nr:MAG: ABC transporter permease [Acidobacteriota bacterium]REK11087.1 MAG: ABC transporter permease [Acidobacteriota bacterium]